MGNFARILVADDEPSVAITLQAILEQEGHTVHAATSAAEARRLIGSSPLDVALLDLRLDDADGIEILEELRERQPECMAIMLTGYASLETAIRAIRFGAYDYLMKPCDLDELKLTIARALERVVMSRALRDRVAELETANIRISAFADELQTRVEEATAELNEKVEELTRAKQALEAAQREREQFISMVAHELAQPLTNINGYAQMLSRPGLSTEARERAHTSIAAGTRRLTRLVQDLVDATRLATGSFQLKLGACDLVQIVTEQVEAARLGAQGRAIILGAAAIDSASLICDRDRITQVISNLVGNALKYAPSGPVRVRVAADGGEAMVSVSDEGPGIPSDRLEMIFEPYVRLTAAQGSRTPQGSGLGLYIARRIVEAHGGRIWAESVPGQGATFLVRLPITTAHPAVSAR